MILHEPFKIGPRLLPALRVGDAWISYDEPRFFIDIPDSCEYVISDFRPPRCGDRKVEEAFSAILSFMLAAGESRRYREMTGRTGENEDLFSSHIVDWITDNMDELSMLAWDIENSNFIE